MNKLRLGLVSLFLSSVLNMFFACKERIAEISTANPKESQSNEILSLQQDLKDENEVEVPYGIQALKHAYPNFIKEIKDNIIIFHDGCKMVYDDSIKKDFITMLDKSDPEDMFYCRYDSKNLPPEYLSDPGRSRSEALFKKMYGTTSNEVQKNLVKVSWFGKTISFTSVNGASEQLVKVATEIAKYPELTNLMDCAGTFYWRPVRGAKRLSAHSYGIAIDIALKNSDYWLWKNPNATETSKIKYNNRIPRLIVEIFERHGFIWGGAWYHYDTMHFEYRPEIIAYSQLLDSN
ncbi:MAG: M15 family metallopeptidase [Bacteroides sp.]|nr:M15 family metallopeptidase [Bacteroides sp.]MBD5339240.1 M15 family metallopeptidase [Bacteroides sp.]